MAKRSLSALLFKITTDKLLPVAVMSILKLVDEKLPSKFNGVSVVMVITVPGLG
jgi:hypothetical protein